MDNNQEENIIEHYIEEREKEEKHRADEHDQELNHKKQYIKVYIMDEYEGDQEILENFAQFFLQYLKENKGVVTEDHNLDLLTFGDVQEIVAKFKKMHPKEKLIGKDIQVEKQPTFLFEPGPIPERESWNAKKVYYSNGGWDYQLSGYEECKKEKPYFRQEMDQKNLAIIFSKNYTKKKGGFFGIGGTMQLWIQIKTNFSEEAVERTASDFIFLRSALAKLYPYTFIPSLDISEKDLNRVEVEAVKLYIINECRKFIYSVCKHEFLYENLYTFRFFKERKYESYLEHKKNNSQTLINHIKLLRNPEGCIEIELSDANEQMKKDYAKKSEIFDKMWGKINDSNQRIIQHLKDVQIELNFQKKQFQLAINDMTNFKHHLQAECYQHLSEIIFCYNDIYTIYGDSMKHYQELFEGLNVQLTQQTQRHWKQFMTYKKDVFDYCDEYQNRRKVFLMKEDQKFKETPKNSTISVDKPKSNPNMSMIDVLGIDSIDERQYIWVDRYSKWQAYINKQFVNGFEKLIETDRQMLVQVMQQKALKVLEQNRREEQSFIKHMSIINP